MARFHYRGRNRTGGMITGTLEASTQDAALNELLNQGITPISVLPMAEQMDIGEWLQDKLPASVKLEELIIFCRQMYALTKAGIPVINALNGLADTMRNATLKKALKQVVQQLESGVTLAAAMQAFPKLFSPIVISMVHVGENTGRLEQAFLQTASYLELERETKKRVSQATRYPTFVLSAISIAMVVLNIWVIPTFAKTFSKMGAELPIQTKILMATSQFFVNYWPELLTGFILATAGFLYWSRTPEGHIRWDKLKLRFPLVGTLFERIALARFCRVMAMMISAGVPVLQSLTVVASAVGNKFIEHAVRDMQSGIERGDSLTRQAGKSGLFTPLVLQMIAVGEETGALDKLLLEVADFYEQEVDYDLKTLADAIEPILLVALGAMVLVLALGIFLPMWNLASAMRH